MITIDRSVGTDRPIQTVYDFLRDFSNAESWDAGTVSCTHARGTRGEVGSTYRNVSRFLGRETELTYRIEELEAPNRIVVVGSNDTVTSTDTITLDSRGGRGGTLVRYRAEFEFSGFARLLEPLLRRPVTRLADETEQTLAAALSRL